MRRDHGWITLRLRNGAEVDAQAKQHLVEKDIQYDVYIS